MRHKVKYPEIDLIHYSESTGICEYIFLGRRYSESRSRLAERISEFRKALKKYRNEISQRSLGICYEDINNHCYKDTIARAARCTVFMSSLGIVKVHQKEVTFTLKNQTYTLPVEQLEKLVHKAKAAQ